MVGRAAYNSWSMLGHIDSVIYGRMPASTISHRQIIEKFQAYSDSVIGQYGPNRPSLRLVVKTVKSLLEETLEAIPVSILDAPLLRQSSACKTAAFTDVHRLMPPPYKEARKKLCMLEQQATDWYYEVKLANYICLPSAWCPSSCRDYNEISNLCIKVVPQQPAGVEAVLLRGLADGCAEKGEPAAYDENSQRGGDDVHEHYIPQPNYLVLCHTREKKKSQQVGSLYKRI